MTCQHWVMMNQMMDLTIRCVECLGGQTISVKANDLERFKSGKGNIQDIFPYLIPSEREMLLSRICGGCWDKMFEDKDDL